MQDFIIRFFLFNYFTFIIYAKVSSLATITRPSAGSLLSPIIDDDICMGISLPSEALNTRSVVVLRPEVKATSIKSSAIFFSVTILENCLPLRSFLSLMSLFAASFTSTILPCYQPG